MPLVFAYGAIMNDRASKLNGRRGFVVDHEVRFSVRGIPLVEPSFAGLHREEGKEAWGVLVEMTEKEWKYFRRAEMAYFHETVIVNTDDGGSHEAWAFFVKERHLLPAPEKLPSSRYAKLLYEGARHHNLPEEVTGYYKQLHDNGNRVSMMFWYLKPVMVPVLRLFR